MHQLTPHIIVLELIRSEDTVLRIKQLSPSAAMFLDYGEEELIGQPVDLIYAAGNDKAVWQAAFANVIVGQSSSVPPKTGFIGEIVTKANHKIRVFISLLSLAKRTPNKTEIVLLIQDKSAEDFSAESA